MSEQHLTSSNSGDSDEAVYVSFEFQGVVEQKYPNEPLNAFLKKMPELFEKAATAVVVATVRNDTGERKQFFYQNAPSESAMQTNREMTDKEIRRAAKAEFRALRQAMQAAKELFDQHKKRPAAPAVDQPAKRQRQATWAEIEQAFHAFIRAPATDQEAKEQWFNTKDVKAFVDTNAFLGKFVSLGEKAWEATGAPLRQWRKVFHRAHSRDDFGRAGLPHANDPVNGECGVCRRRDMELRYSIGEGETPTPVCDECTNKLNVVYLALFEFNQLGVRLRNQQPIHAEVQWPILQRNLEALARACSAELDDAPPPVNPAKKKKKTKSRAGTGKRYAKAMPIGKLKHGLLLFAGKKDPNHLKLPKWVNDFTGCKDTIKEVTLHANVFIFRIAPLWENEDQPKYHRHSPNSVRSVVLDYCFQHKDNEINWFWEEKKESDADQQCLYCKQPTPATGSILVDIWIGEQGVASERYHYCGPCGLNMQACYAAIKCMHQLFNQRRDKEFMNIDVAWKQLKPVLKALDARPTVHASLERAYAEQLAKDREAKALEAADNQK